MDKLRKIDNIMFRVSDLGKAAEFYEKTLGLKKAWTDDERGMIGFTFPESDSEIVIHNDASIPNPDFSFLVDDVERMCTTIRSKGQQVCLEPIDVRCGKFAILSDLDGNKYFLKCSSPIHRAFNFVSELGNFILHSQFTKGFE